MPNEVSQYLDQLKAGLSRVPQVDPQLGDHVQNQVLPYIGMYGRVSWFCVMCDA